MGWLKIWSVPSRLAVTVRRHGLLVACRRGWRRASETLRERRLGIRTGGSIDATTLNTGTAGFGYQPIPYAAFESALKAVRIDPDDVFIDVGCGMGRAVVLAGANGFRRVVGVEISAELCERARGNVENARRHLRTKEVEIVAADACEFPVPDDVTVLLLFNPFDEPILRRVLENLRQSLVRNPRKVTVIYAIPKSRHDVLADIPWLRLEQTLRIRDEEWLRLAIYRSTKGLE